METNNYDWKNLIDVDFPKSCFEGPLGICSVGRFDSSYTTNAEYEARREKILNTPLP